ncbi:hypothetical protein FA15DRAFT_661590 [Coprinopsis marcescibilis]|uniref:Uncharacterized protein n=1 Tax=Coprinopsis marcescibilis TaxID=230819 RepID=A0A5C3KB59_COPMA|nr:hypothetical protein FA15DRAFT_661590 [Coprinopsis marcescibilis]
MSSNRGGPRVGRSQASDAANSQRSSAPATVPPIPLSDDQLALVPPASRPGSSLSQSRSSITPTRQHYVADTPAPPPSRTTSRVGGQQSASEDSPSRQPSPQGSMDLKMKDITPSVSGPPQPIFLSLTLEPETVEEDFKAATLALKTVTSLLQTCNEYPDDYALRDPLLIWEALKDFAAALDLPAWQKYILQVVLSSKMRNPSYRLRRVYSKQMPLPQYEWAPRVETQNGGCQLTPPE